MELATRSAWGRRPSKCPREHWSFQDLGQRSSSGWLPTDPLLCSRSRSVKRLRSVLCLPCTPTRSNRSLIAQARSEGTIVSQDPVFCKYLCRDSLAEHGGLGQALRAESPQQGTLLGLKPRSGSGSPLPARLPRRWVGVGCSSCSGGQCAWPRPSRDGPALFVVSKMMDWALPWAVSFFLQLCRQATDSILRPSPRCKVRHLAASASVSRVMAVPSRSMRPVRPTRWVSNSELSGNS